MKPTTLHPLSLVLGGLLVASLAWLTSAQGIVTARPEYMPPAPHWPPRPENMVTVTSANDPLGTGGQGLITMPAFSTLTVYTVPQFKTLVLMTMATSGLGVGILEEHYAGAISVKHSTANTLTLGGGSFGGPAPIGYVFRSGAHVVIRNELSVSRSTTYRMTGYLVDA